MIVREAADARGIPRVFPSLEEPAVEIVDIAVPPAEQPAVIRRVLAGGRKVRGILVQKPPALALSEARALVEECARAGVPLLDRESCRVSERTRLAYLRNHPCCH